MQNQATLHKSKLRPVACYRSRLWETFGTVFINHGSSILNYGTLHLFLKLEYLGQSLIFCSKISTYLVGSEWRTVTEFSLCIGTRIDVIAFNYVVNCSIPTTRPPLQCQKWDISKNYVSLRQASSETMLKARVESKAGRSVVQKLSKSHFEQFLLKYCISFFL